MKRAFVLLPVVGAVSMATWLGCGGATSGDFAAVTTDGGDGTEGGSTSTGSGGSSVMTADGGPSFDPGAIGGLIGGGSDGGVASGDAGIGGGVISPEVVDGCNALCTKEAAANCPNQGTLNSCIVGCRLILNNPKCLAPANALFACEKDSPVACDAQGKATLTSCGVEQLSAAACFLQNAKDPTLTVPCMSFCAGAAAANCPNDDPAGCAVGCPVYGNFIPACNMYWQKFVTCGSTAKFTCGMDGKANPQGCDLQGAAFLICTIGGVLNTGDAGQ